MREALTILAAGAAATAFTVLGISTNRPLGALLLIAAFVLWLVAHNEERALQVWRQFGGIGRGLVVVGVLGFIGLGWYLATNFNEPPASTVDEVARKKADDAVTETSELKTQIATLRTEVETAMQFQQNEKEAREARESAADAERRRKQMARDALSELLDSGNAVSREIMTSRNAPRERANKWITQAEAELRRVLDESYVRRSRDGAGIALGARSWSEPPSPELSRAVADLDIRLARIQEFLQEL